MCVCVYVKKDKKLYVMLHRPEGEELLSFLVSRDSLQTLNPKSFNLNLKTRIHKVVLGFRV